MLITTENELLSLMPTARWKQPGELYGYLEEEERVTLEPLLGAALYKHLLKEYERLKETYVDITATTIKPTGKARQNPILPYADVTEKLNDIQDGMPYDSSDGTDVYDDVPEEDLLTVQLIRICQQIEFYKMLSHKTGLLNVSLNAGGGMNRVSADGYDTATDSDVERATRDAFKSAGRSIDTLLLFLEDDAKGNRLFTEMWSEADAFYLHKDLLFQTARVLKEYLDIDGRMEYVRLVRDIRFCQNTYLKPRIGAKLLKAALAWANTKDESPFHSDGTAGSFSGASSESPEPSESPEYSEVIGEVVSMLRQALAFYVEARRVDLLPAKEKLARRDSMTDAQQGMAMACDYIKENLDALGDASVNTPIYNNVKEAEAQAKSDAANAQAARERRCKASRQQTQRKLFTGFPMTHRGPERK